MSWVAFCTLLLLLPPLQLAVMPHFRIGGATPDIALLVGLYVALYAPRRQALVANWLLGLTRDLGSQVPFGFHAALFTIGALLVERVRTEIFRDHMLTRIMVAGLLCLGVAAITGALATLWLSHLSPHVVIARLTAWTLYTTFLTPFVCTVLDMSEKFFHVGPRSAETELIEQP